MLHRLSFMEVDMSLDYNAANVKGYERLEVFVDRLADKDYDRQVGAGWSIGSILAHLAFWDFRVLELIKRWKQAGVSPSPVDPDIINDATKPLFMEIPGREAVKLVLSAAKAVDAEIENLPEELLPGIVELVKQGKFRLDRSDHRNDHLDELEKMLDES